MDDKEAKKDDEGTIGEIINTRESFLEFIEKDFEDDDNSSLPDNCRK